MKTKNLSLSEIIHAIQWPPTKNDDKQTLEHGINIVDKLVTEYQIQAQTRWWTDTGQTRMKEFKQKFAECQTLKHQADLIACLITYGTLGTGVDAGVRMSGWGHTSSFEDHSARIIFAKKFLASWFPLTKAELRFKIETLSFDEIQKVVYRFLFIQTAVDQQGKLKKETLDQVLKFSVEDSQCVFTRQRLTEIYSRPDLFRQHCQKQIRQWRGDYADWELLKIGRFYDVEKLIKSALTITKPEILKSFFTTEVKCQVIDTDSQNFLISKVLPRLLQRCGLRNSDVTSAHLTSPHQQHT